MIVKFLEIDVPNLNGRIYPKEVMEREIKSFLERNGQRSIPIFINSSDIYKVSDIVGFVNDIKIEEGYVQGEVEFINGKISGGEPICIRPTGIGSVKDWIVQDDYRLDGFSILCKNIPYEKE